MTIQTQNLVSQIETVQRKDDLLVVYFTNGQAVGYEREKKTQWNGARTIEYCTGRILYAQLSHKCNTDAHARDIVNNEQSTFSSGAQQFFHKCERTKKQTGRTELENALLHEYQLLRNKIKIECYRPWFSFATHGKVSNPEAFHKRPTGNDVAVIFKGNPKQNIKNLSSWGHDPSFVFPNGIHIFPYITDTFEQSENAKVLYKQAQYFLPVEEKQKKTIYRLHGALDLLVAEFEDFQQTLTYETQKELLEHLGFL